MKQLDRGRLSSDIFLMPSYVRGSLRRAAAGAAVLAGLAGCSATPPPAPPAVAAPTHAPVAPPVPRWTPDPAHPVMLGIDVLQADGFAQIRGKTVGLLTHAAGVNMHGMSTIDVLRHAPGVRLACLFSAENGLSGEYPSGKNYTDHVDARTGLMVHSLYNGVSYRPTKAQLAGLDAVVIDLQDIGSRSYTFTSAMRFCLEGCFENNVEVIVLDRPNPLGGLKVDGPPLDPKWVSYVGAFRVPYVYGLTMGELATMAKEAPGVLNVPDAVRANGRLTVIAMRGWHRSMLWPDTRLTWIPTSPYVPDFSAVEGYPLTGLGCELGGFRNGIGSAFPFRGVSYHGVRLDTLERELRSLNIPGLDYRRVSVTDPRTGKAEVGLYIEITDWERLRPTELSLYMMALTCAWDPRNPFATATKTELSLYMKCMGSTALYNDLVAHGSHADIASYVRDWQVKNEVYQQQSRRYWLYY
jgi:uncharacterized protein YbbC (DUF1343 family)